MAQSFHIWYIASSRRLLLLNRWGEFVQTQKNDPLVVPYPTYSNVLIGCIIRSRGQKLVFQIAFIYARLKMGHIMGTLGAGGRRPQGFRSLSQRVFIRSLSNLVNMLVGIISRSSSITSQIPTRHSWIMALELSKKWISGICSPSRKTCSQKCCH